MVVVLSEINCLDTLNKKGLYPDEFYTDFTAFKNNMASFRDATVIILFAGNCRFNKKQTIEVAKGLIKRADSEYDRGIKKVVIISDVTLSGVDLYYKYEGNLNRVDMMKKWSVINKNLDILSKLQTEKRESICYLSDYDNGEIDDMLKVYESRFKGEDEYKDLISISDVKKLLSLS